MFSAYIMFLYNNLPLAGHGLDQSKQHLARAHAGMQLVGALELGQVHADVEMDDSLWMSESCGTCPGRTGRGRALILPRDGSRLNLGLSLSSSCKEPWRRCEINIFPLLFFSLLYFIFQDFFLENFFLKTLYTKII